MGARPVPRRPGGSSGPRVASELLHKSTSTEVDGNVRLSIYQRDNGTGTEPTPPEPKFVRGIRDYTPAKKVSTEPRPTTDGLDFSVCDIVPSHP